VVNIGASLEKGKLTITVSPRGDLASCAVTKEFNGDFEQSRDPEAMKQVFTSAFSRLGDTNLELGTVEFRTPNSLFIPVSRLNAWRREICKAVEEGIETERRRNMDLIAAKFQAPAPFGTATRKDGLSWSIKTDRLSHLSKLGADDWADISEVVVDIGNEPFESLLAGLAKLEDQIGRNRIRLALPILTRRWEVSDLQAKIKRLLNDGWSRWEAGNLSAWDFVSHSEDPEFDLTADWPLNVLNRATALELRRLGARRFVLSPEDGIDNMTALAERLGERVTAVVYQDTPLFISESCPKANLKGCKRKGDACAQREETMRIVSSDGEEMVVVNRGCRAITIGAKPFCVAGHLKKLTAAGISSVRADFVWRGYSPEEVLEIWRFLRGGQEIRGSRKANILRGLM
jgi:U32 family peptidase